MRVCLRPTWKPAFCCVWLAWWLDLTLYYKTYFARSVHDCSCKQNLCRRKTRQIIVSILLQAIKAFPYIYPRVHNAPQSSFSRINCTCRDVNISSIGWRTQTLSLCFLISNASKTSAPAFCLSKFYYQNFIKKTEI